MTLRFAVTWDYRCPFARIAHRHVLAGLDDGADWDVTFVPFSLGQIHVEEGEPPIWEHPDDDTGLLALQVGVAVRDNHPDRFPALHRALFEARHADGARIRDPDVVRSVLTREGLDADAVMAEVAGGKPLDVIRDEHTAVAGELDVWGVPTFMVDERAVFVRLMELPVDNADGRRTVERIVDMLTGWPQLNEFKHTTLDR
ncbi:MAG TPA: DsbA family protein [Acidimicrobiales bacterium]